MEIIICTLCTVFVKNHVCYIHVCNVDREDRVNFENEKYVKSLKQEMHLLSSSSSEQKVLDNIDFL